MVMNHLKKAKELNGNTTYGNAGTSIPRVKKLEGIAKIKTDLLTAELQEYVKTLV
jgi:hypothetical protein